MTSIRLDLGAIEELKDTAEARADLRRRAENIAERARQLVHVETGRLKASIEVREGHDGGLEVGATAPYALYVELGTRHEEPHPFLRPAMDAGAA